MSFCQNTLIEWLAFSTKAERQQARGKEKERVRKIDRGRETKREKWLDGDREFEREKREKWKGRDRDKIERVIK